MRALLQMQGMRVYSWHEIVINRELTDELIGCSNFHGSHSQQCESE
jgi:hypothetical protein